VEKNEYSAIFALLLAGSAPAQEGGGLDISAFADIIFPVSPDSLSGSQVRVNQAEIDLEGVIAEDVTAAMALAYDPDAETFALAVLAVEVPLHETESWSAALTAGQFDVPFGIDYQVYASVDRRLVHGPLFVDFTHEGWNDMGANLNLAAGGFGADVFFINGSAAGRGVVNPAKIWDRQDIKRAEGARVHYGVLEGVEVGLSGAWFHDLADVTTMTLMGADFQAALGAFSCKGEFISNKVDRDTPFEATHEGFYLQGMYEYGQFFGVARYDKWNPGIEGAEAPERLSLGAGYVVREGLELRLEHDAGLKELDDVTWLQMVMNFGSIGE
jgi:hypothetical protein